MKKLFPFLALLIILSGCYESTVPIEAPSTPINPALLGKWKVKHTDNEFYLVSKLNEYTYKIEGKVPNYPLHEMYYAHLSKLEGDDILNMQDRDSNSMFIFFKVALNKKGDKATIWSVSDSLTEKFNTSKELKEYFKREMTKSVFYDKVPTVMHKVK